MLTDAYGPLRSLMVPYGPSARFISVLPMVLKAVEFAQRSGGGAPCTPCGLGAATGVVDEPVAGSAIPS